MGWWRRLGREINMFNVTCHSGVDSFFAAAAAAAVSQQEEQCVTPTHLMGINCLSDCDKDVKSRCGRDCMFDERCFR